jgi:hemolysin III
MSEKPLLRGHFHQAMFFVALGACVPLIARCETFPQLISISVYTLCTLALFGISSLYHRLTWTPKKRLLWRKLDHAGIYLMIAGSFTPVAILGLGEPSGITLLATIWGVALLGILQSIFFVNLPKLISASIYLVAGYLILPYVSELRDSIGATNIALIVAGGLVYTLGALSYGLKRPILSPRYFGYHEVFHVLVNCGAIIHFVVIQSLVG